MAIGCGFNRQVQQIGQIVQRVFRSVVFSEGGYRVPATGRWPSKIKPGEFSNEMFSGLDWFLALLVAAGDTDVKNKLLKR